MSIHLSVNINKIALIRNSRGGNNPNIISIAKDIENFGADGITVHPRPDQRHIRYTDVENLKATVSTELNVEGYPDKRFMELVLNTKPHQVTLVPDPPNALTSTSGWDTITHQDFLKDIVTRLKNEGISVSIFLNPNPELVQPAKETGADRIELYTEPFARAFENKKHESAIQPFIETANAAQKSGLGLNAGHDLNLLNLNFFAKKIPGLLEVSIGHALISDALYFGLQSTIIKYKAALKS
jgi:pyridoxine 5-phosphate synthase